MERETVPHPPEDGQTRSGSRSVTEAYEQAALGAAPGMYELVLFVAGSAPRSLRAVKVVRALCDEYLAGRHALEIVDIYQQPLVAEEAGVLAVPMLVKKQPPPVRKFIGDLTNLETVLLGLNLPAKPELPGDGEAP